MSQSVQLPGGTVAYDWFGPAGGPLAVCIHGLTTPSYVFAGTARTLSDMGYRTLTYDLWGRGGSDTPPGRQTPAYFAEQLTDLLTALDLPVPRLLLGYSMGGVIAADVAATHPPGAVILMASAGVQPITLDPALSSLAPPISGDVWARTGAAAAIRRGLQSTDPGPILIPDLNARLMAETRKPDYIASVQSSIRHCLTDPQDDTFRALKDRGVPILAIWGAEDAVIGARAPGRLAELCPDAHHAQIPRAGHMLALTHPLEVARALDTFLSGDEPARARRR